MPEMSFHVIEVPDDKFAVECVIADKTMRSKQTFATEQDAFDWIETVRRFGSHSFTSHAADARIELH